MRTDAPPRRSWRLGLLAAAIATFALVVSFAPEVTAQDDFQGRLERGWAAAAAGNDTAALLAAVQILDKLGRDGDPAIRDGALILRAHCRFNGNERGRAAGDLRRTKDAFAVFDADWMPADAIREEFIRWAEESGLLGTTDGTGLPSLSLTELNPETITNEVTSNFVMDVEIVRIPVIVEDIRGDFISGLQAELFEVVDGRPPAQPVYQLIADDEPTSLGILIDASSAIAEHEALVRQTVTRLLSDLRPEDQAFVVQFGGEAAFLSDFRDAGELHGEAEALREAAKAAKAAADALSVPGEGTAFAGDREAVDLIPGYRTGGDRSLRDAVALGLIRMRTARYDKKALILISAGDDTASATTEADLLLAAQREGVAINTLLVGQNLDRWRPGEEVGAPTAFLQQLAHQTGGLVALRPAVEERFGGLEGWLDLAIADLSAYIRHQYLLLFESFDPPARGEWRALSVRVDTRYERVRARSGYVR
jgi:Ca-activated chloride channel family protein